MESRQQIKRWNKLRIYPANQYQDLWKISNLTKLFSEINEKYPDSIFEEFYEIDEDQRGFGSMEYEPVMGNSTYLRFTYYSPETDEEFEKRMIEQEKRKKKIEEEEKLEYLRLKAKFETKTN